MSNTSVSLPPKPAPSRPEPQLGLLGLPKIFYLGGLLPLFIVFSFPLYQLARFALGSELYSYALLVPFVSGFLFWIKRPTDIAPDAKRLSPLWAAGLALVGAAALARYGFILFNSPQPATQDTLVLAAYAFVLLLTGACCWFLNLPTLRALAFPLGFLVFMAPLPLAAELRLENLLQHGSSFVAQKFFQVIGTPVFREGTVFHLPGFTMQVAPECSGIHSTLALFITSLVAGQLLLRSNWSRTLLALAVIPIALLRNGLRVTTIGELCVRIGPEMIDSYIHRHGGPIFFAISLIPFYFALHFLIKIDRKIGN